MRQLCLRLVLLLSVLSSLNLAAAPGAGAQTPGGPVSPTAQPSQIPPGCQRGVLPHGALSLICLPPGSEWNGEFIVWAHGYVAFNQPLDFYHLTLGDLSLPELAQFLGFGFATTSYRANGLVVPEGVEDIRELVAAVRAVTPYPPRRTYLLGASEGGQIATLSIEQSPALFSSGLAMCGPIGNFQMQVNYIGDFRVLFDYFFPGVLPGSPIVIPRELMAGWDSTYVPRIQAALSANPSAARQLIAVSTAAIDPAVPSTLEQTTLSLLWYSTFATNDATAKLGGNPFGNRDVRYSGSDNDAALNARVARFDADLVALINVSERYETSGRLMRPLVTLHTTDDELVPEWHELLYLEKAAPSGGGSLWQVPAFRYGHCRFNTAEVLAAFVLLLVETGATPPAALTERPDVQSELATLRAAGPSPAPARAPRR